MQDRLIHASTRWLSAQGFLLLVTLLFCACEEPELKKTETPQNFSEIFETFWRKMNSNYVYWDIDSTDWNKTYREYKNVFSTLDVNNDADVYRSVDHFRKITEKLTDGHFSIQFKHRSVMNETINPLMDRRKASGELHPLYSYRPYDTVYLDAGFKLGIDAGKSFSLSPLICLSGTIDHKILYFSCNQFSLAQSYYDNPSGGVKMALDYFFDQLQNTSTSINGLIIDVRGNSGGDLADLNFILGRIIEKPLHIGYTQYKRDRGRKDLTPWIKAFVNPLPGAKTFRLPIVVIADNYSASLAETFVMAIRAVPHGIFVGERTWGATGPVVASDVYQSGSFEVGDFMSVQASSCKFKYLDNIIYEGRGLTPDVSVPHSHDAYEAGVDVQLEKAISQIKIMD
jgi:hypothetical protein